MVKKFTLNILGTKESSVLCLQILAEAIKAQAAELRASVDSMKDMLKSFQDKQDAADRQTRSSLSLADLRQELQSFASTAQ